MSDMKRLLSGAYILGYSDARNDKAIDPISTIERLTMNLNQEAIEELEWFCAMKALKDQNHPSAESEAYNRGWKEGREALIKELWEDGRDRLD